MPVLCDACVYVYVSADLDRRIKEVEERAQAAHEHFIRAQTELQQSNTQLAQATGTFNQLNTGDRAGQG